MVHTTTQHKHQSAGEYKPHAQRAARRRRPTHAKIEAIKFTDWPYSNRHAATACVSPQPHTALLRSNPCTRPAQQHPMSATANPRPLHNEATEHLAQASQTVRPLWAELCNRNLHACMPDGICACTSHNCALEQRQPQPQSRGGLLPEHPSQLHSS